MLFLCAIVAKTMLLPFPSLSVLPAKIRCCMGPQKPQHVGGRWDCRALRRPCFCWRHRVLAWLFGGQGWAHGSDIHTAWMSRIKPLLELILIGSLGDTFLPPPSRASQWMLLLCDVALGHLSQRPGATPFAI